MAATDAKSHRTFDTWIMCLARWRGMDDSRFSAAYDRIDPIDKHGDRIHLALGVFYCFFLGWPLSFVEIAAIPLGVCTAIRLWFNRRRLGLQFLMLPSVMFLCFWLWHTAAMMWAPDMTAAKEHGGRIRFAMSLLSLFPIVRYRTLLTLAIAAGFLCGVASQAINAVGVWLDVPWLVVRDYAATGRNGGWWPEVVGGEILVAALGLHLPAAMLAGKVWGWKRLGAIAASVATLVGIAATGTRGAWIAAAALLTLGMVVAVARLPTARLRVTLSALALGGVLVAGGIAGLTMGDSLTRRYTDARNELVRMLERGEYETNTGMRVKMIVWSWHAFTERPFTGIGVNGLRAHVLASRTEATGRELSVVEHFEREGHGHAHNSVMQLLATTGFPGLLFFVVGVAGSLWAGFLRLAPEEKGTYAEGAVWGLLGMLLIMPFDVVYISAQPAAVFYVLLGLCPAWRPRSRLSM
ncbi:MAG: O-antigen ligase family protein [Phycisphaerae bacterium]|nr:O-antigen ligase family protein [Phycisphaerae bacterium]